MDWLKSLAKGITSLFRRRHVEQELDEELQGYLEASTDHKLRNGMTEDEARRAANVELGSSNSVKHQIWSSRWESTLEGILKDIRAERRAVSSKAPASPQQHCFLSRSGLAAILPSSL